MVTLLSVVLTLLLNAIEISLRAGLCWALYPVFPQMFPSLPQLTFWQIWLILLMIKFIFGSIDDDVVDIRRIELKELTGEDEEEE